VGGLGTGIATGAAAKDKQETTRQRKINETLENANDKIQLLAQEIIEEQEQALKKLEEISKNVGKIQDEYRQTISLVLNQIESICSDAGSSGQQAALARVQKTVTIAKKVAAESQQQQQQTTKK